MPQYEFQYIPVDNLLPNPHRPRFKVDQQALLKLADSIRQYGVFQPILVGKTTAGLQIVAGERRWRAAKVAGIKELPALVFDASSVDLIIYFLEENLQREEINLLEQAVAIQKLTAKDIFTIPAMAKRLKIDEDRLREILAINTLPEKVKDAYLEGKISNDGLIEMTRGVDPLVAAHQTNA